MVTDGFGFRDDSWGGFGVSSFGLFGILQLFFGIIVVISIIPGLIVLIKNAKDSLGRLALLYGLIPFYMVLVSFVYGFIGNNFAVSQIYESMTQMQFFLTFYIAILLIYRRKGLKIAINSMGLYSVIFAISLLLIYIFDIQSNVVTILMSDDATRSLRIIIPAPILLFTGACLFFARYLISKGLLNLFLSIICIFVSTLQLHRGVLIGTIAVIFTYVWLNRYNSKILYIYSILLIVGFVLVVNGDSIFDYTSSSIFDYTSSSILEMLEVAGNFGHRVFVILNSFEYIISNTLGLGVGVVWEYVTDFELYLMNAFIAGPTYDSTYANVIILLGFPGVLLLSYLAVSLHRLFKLLQAKSNPTFIITMGFFLGPLSIYLMLISVTSDILFLENSSAIVAVIFAISFRLHKLIQYRNKLT